MTLAEFEATGKWLACQTCGYTGGLLIEENANNGGKRPLCPRCGSKTPLAGVQWLRQQIKSAPRRVHDTREVWTLNGDHCTFCGKSWELCDRLGIGRSTQHVMPFYKGGGEWPVVPFCARCQQASAAALEETRRVDARIASLDEIIKRIEARNPELRG